MSIELSLSQKRFVDISLSFDSNPTTGDLVTISNERSINNSIKNLINILPSEVPFRQDIGSDVTNYLFDLMDEGTAGMITLEVERTLAYNEPRIRVIEVFTEAQPDQNQFQCTIKYQIIGYDQVFTVNQILTPTR
jgi:phage baseplate assembly protein W